MGGIFRWLPRWHIHVWLSSRPLLARSSTKYNVDLASHESLPEISHASVVVRPAVASHPTGGFGRKLAQLATLADATEARTLIGRLNIAYAAAGTPYRVERVAAGYRLTMGRAASADEIARAVAFLEKSSLERLCLLWFNLSEFLYVD